MSATSTTPTEEERRWALLIKQRAVAEGLLPLSDLEYLQHAIVAKENSGKAIKRIRRMQGFREQYRLRGAEYDDPLALLKRCTELFPGFLMVVDKDTHGRAVQVSDYKKFFPKVLKSDDEWRVMMGAFYYMFNAMSSDLDAIRHGIVFASDCNGMGWENFSFEVEKRAAQFYQDAYPVRMKSVVMLDAPMILHIMFEIVKVFLSQKIKDVVKLERSEEYFGQGELPQSAIPARFGGTGSEESAFKFVEEHLKIRANNEVNIKLE